MRHSRATYKGNDEWVTSGTWEGTHFQGSLVSIVSGIFGRLRYLPCAARMSAWARVENVLYYCANLAKNIPCPWKNMHHSMSTDLERCRRFTDATFVYSDCYQANMRTAYYPCTDFSRNSFSFLVFVVMIDARVIQLGSPLARMARTRSCLRGDSTPAETRSHWLAMLSIQYDDMLLVVSRWT